MLLATGRVLSTFRYTRNSCGRIVSVSCDLLPRDSITIVSKSPRWLRARIGTFRGSVWQGSISRVGVERFQIAETVVLVKNSSDCEATCVRLEDDRF